LPASPQKAVIFQMSAQKIEHSMQIEFQYSR
jgi:hypothetical protein